MVDYTHKIEVPEGFIDYLIEKDHIELKQIFVEKKYRRQGVGIKMLEKLKKVSKKHNINKIIVNSSTYEPQVFYK